MVRFNKIQKLVAICSLLVIIQGCVSGSFEADPVFAGSNTCVECHEKEYLLWKGSDHDHAMDTAISTTVLGDFNDATFEHHGFVSRFYTKADTFFVFTKGPGGIPGDFQIAYTFGFRPLQQYLVPFNYGRLQSLPIAWDTEKKLWYHMEDAVYEGEEIPPDDWLYWTNNGQNWNGMCAECHSTNLQKNYNPETHLYNTTWSEIDVSCEACHGPASNHNEWAGFNSLKKSGYDNYGLVVQTSNINSRTLVDQCAYCHARRTSFDNFEHPPHRLFDLISPVLPLPPNYYPDGQILEEDYVYASFTQSKMHQNKVRCTNCHDAHSLKLKYTGNNLCAQCHRKEQYDTYAHHFHKDFNEPGQPLVLDEGETVVAVGEGAQCVNCHMPGRYFMGVDYRRDHSMRIPRPDISQKLGTPNACTQCHTDQTNQWAASYTFKWYGSTERFHFGETMFMAEKGDATAIPLLIDLIKAETTSPIVRASAVSYFNYFRDERLNALNRKLLQDEEALVRREAVKAFVANDLTDLSLTLSPLLTDSTRMVRMEAASRLAAIPPENFDPVQPKHLNSAIAEYIAAMEYTADFAASRHNLGNLYSNTGQNEEAALQYQEAIRIDDAFYPAKVNLAMLYNSMGRNREAEALLKEVHSTRPGNGDIAYSLGLLLAEEKKYAEAIQKLKEAARLSPDNARISYNLGLLQDFMGDAEAAESSLLYAAQREPANIGFQVALIDFYIKRKQFEKAKPLALQYKQTFPDDKSVDQLIEFIETELN